MLDFAKKNELLQGCSDAEKSALRHVARVYGLINELIQLTFGGKINHIKSELKWMQKKLWLAIHFCN